MNNVKVNIIVISYNAFEYLKTTIERIFKATKNTLLPNNCR